MTGPNEPQDPNGNEQARDPWAPPPSGAETASPQTPTPQWGAPGGDAAAPTQQWGGGAPTGDPSAAPTQQWGQEPHQQWGQQQQPGQGGASAWGAPHGGQTPQSNDQWGQQAPQWGAPGPAGTGPQPWGAPTTPSAQPGWGQPGQQPGQMGGQQWPPQGQPGQPWQQPAPGQGGQPGWGQQQQQPGSGPWQPPHNPDGTPGGTRSKLPLILGGVGVLVVVIAVVIGFMTLGGGTTLDSEAAQAGVAQVLTESYGAQEVGDVSCQGDQKVEAGASFECTVTVDGQHRSVTLTFTDDNGTYEVSRPN